MTVQSYKKYFSTTQLQKVRPLKRKDVRKLTFCKIVSFMKSPT